MQRRIGVVLNHSAGSSNDRSLRDRVEKLFGAGTTVLQVDSQSSGAALGASAQRLIEERCDVLVAAGGDGTVSSLASLLVGSKIVLGVLPMGTLNHFARDLGIPSDLEGASQVILAGHSTEIDVGEVNGRFFINNSSLGLYPSIVRRRELRERTGSSRLLAFAAATFFALRRYPFLDAHVRVDGSGIDRRSPFFFIGNNSYEVEGLRLGSRLRLNGGLLSLYTAHRTGRLGLLRIAISALFHRLRQNRDFEVLEAHQLSISTRRKDLAVALDGEVVHMTPPLLYSIRPAALRVMVPS